MTGRAWVRVLSIGLTLDAILALTVLAIVRELT